MKTSIFGYSAVAMFGAIVSSSAIADPLLHGVKQIAAGMDHACAILEDTSVACWGDADYGQLGNPYHSGPVTVPVPVYIAGAWKQQLTGVIAVTAGFHFTCALQRTGSVFCWGTNGSGELGIGASDSFWHFGATKVQIPEPVAAISAQAYSEHACALMSDSQHTVRCWGANFYGQLGSGSSDSASPVEVQVTQMDGSQTALIGVTQISIGNYHSCAILANTSAACWGNNSYGQLGDGTHNSRSSPKLVVISELDGSKTLLTDISQIAGGGIHTCAVLASTMSAACWGDNSRGQLGVPAITFSTPSPTGIPSLGVKQLSGGNNHTCAVLADSRLACWGDNTYGELGDAVPSSRSPVVLSATATQVAAGNDFTCALMTDTGVQCWGRGDVGQLGAAAIYDSSQLPLSVRPVDYSDDRIFASGFSG
jgi:alpha-tubulin suppressor-like RCC1 family protein